MRPAIPGDFHSGSNLHWLDSRFVWYVASELIEPEIDYWTTFESWDDDILEVCSEDIDEYQIVRAICLECGESLSHCVCD